MLPIAPDDAFSHRVPRVGIVVLAAAIALTLVAQGRMDRYHARLAVERTELSDFLRDHPEVPLPRGIGSLAFPPSPSVLASRRAAAREVERRDAEDATTLRRTLDWMVQRVHATESASPLHRLGVVPANPQPLALLTHSLVQPSWGGLIATFFVLFALTVFLEEAWGIVLCAVVWLVSGAVSVLVVASFEPELRVPLVGGAGAVAGLLGAFIVRFPHKRVRWWWPGPGGVAGRALPSWSVPLAWFALQAVLPAVGVETGVGALRVVSGFAVGGAMAMLVARSGWDMALGAGAVELDLAPRARAAFQKAVTASERGDLMAAERALLVADRRDPRSSDIAALAWEVMSQKGPRPDAERFGTRVIQDQLGRGDVSQAVETWRGMRGVIGHQGSPAIRWRLAQAALGPLPSRARDLLTGLATDDDAGALRERAQALLVSLSPATGTPPEGLVLGDLSGIGAPAKRPAVAAPVPPPAPTPVPAPTPPPAPKSDSRPVHAADQAWLHAAANPVLAYLDATLDPDDPMRFGATGQMPALNPDVTAERTPWPVPAPPAPRTKRGLEVKRSSLVAVEATTLELARGVSFDLARVEAVSVARIQSPLGEVVIMDLLVQWRAKHAPAAVRALRLDGATSDVGAAIDMAGISVDAAFVRLARQVVSAAAARPIPAELTLGTVEQAAEVLPTWDSLEEYEAALLALD
ncbi:MAG: rhomboid family intramembrane serine protease [Myxococcota bacterium]